MSYHTQGLFTKLYDTEHLTVSIFSDILDVKENTLRTWLSRHFSDLGKKSETGRVTYSLADAISLRVFTELVQNFSLSPDAAKTATILCCLRYVEIFEIVTSDDVDVPDPLYFLFKKIDQYNIVFEPLKFEQIIEYISDNNEDTLIIIPVDNLIHSTLKKIDDYMEAMRNILPPEDEKKPMTKDEIEARYNEKIIHF